MVDVVLTPQLIGSVIALIFGVIVLLFPKILNYLIALYLIVIGILGIISAVGIM